VLAASTPAASVAEEAAQHRDDALRASFEAHLHDFDYLLGDWSFVAKNKRSGAFLGHWTAERLPGGQVLDEFRIDGRGRQAGPSRPLPRKLTTF